jgi:hypothetical protein
MRMQRDINAANLIAMRTAAGLQLDGAGEGE